MMSHLPAPGVASNVLEKFQSGCRAQKTSASSPHTATSSSKQVEGHALVPETGTGRPHTIDPDQALEPDASGNEAEVPFSILVQSREA
jgi:hypothetical protein